MRIEPFEQVLHAEPLAADVLHSPLVLSVHGLHDQAHQPGRLVTQFLQINLHRVVGTVHRLPVVDEVAHLHIQQQRFVGVLDIERVKVPVLGNHAHVRLVAEMLHRGLHPDHVIRAVSLAGYQVGGTEVHVLDG